MTRLPPAPAEAWAPRDASLDGLAPGFRRKLEAVVAQLEAAGHQPLIFETLRTDARQQYLHGYGRRWDDGRGVVTHSETAGTTWHGYGLAADIICRGRQWSATPHFWRDLGAACNLHGLEWGGFWRFVDRPHVQWAPMRRSPSTLATSLFAQGEVGIRRVWEIVGADA